MENSSTIVEIDDNNDQTADSATKNCSEHVVCRICYDGECPYLCVWVSIIKNKNNFAPKSIITSLKNVKTILSCNPNTT